MNVLEARGLHTYYGKSHVLHGVDLTIREGEIVTLLGRNGAGKTTTMRSIVGLTPAREGTVSIFGRVTTAWPSYRIACCGVGYVPFIFNQTAIRSGGSSRTSVFTEEGYWFCCSFFSTSALRSRSRFDGPASSIDFFHAATASAFSPNAMCTSPRWSQMSVC